jgi:hypothetical protein
MAQVVPHGAAREYKRARGVAELYLTRRNPTFTFWNDPATRRDAWGTITLKWVERDGTVVIDFSGTELRARPNYVFPGTGIRVIASHAELGTALLRTRWTHTIFEAPRPPTTALSPP